MAALLPQVTAAGLCSLMMVAQKGNKMKVNELAALCKVPVKIHIPVDAIIGYDNNKIVLPEMDVDSIRIGYAEGGNLAIIVEPKPLPPIIRIK